MKKAKQKIVIIGVLTLILIAIACIPLLYLEFNDKKPDNINSENKCKDGYTINENKCVSKKVDFSCEGNLEQGKGINICKKIITNINIIPNYRNILNNKTLLSVKGKSWEEYMLKQDPNSQFLSSPDNTLSFFEIESYNLINNTNSIPNNTNNISVD